jgi:hypothetical protein
VTLKREKILNLKNCKNTEDLIKCSTKLKNTENKNINKKMRDFIEAYKKKNQIKISNILKIPEK